MICPSIEVLIQCLEGDRFDTEPALAQHVASCRICQQQLNSLSDDAQLAQWRDFHSSSDVAHGSEAECLAVVKHGLSSLSTDGSPQADDTLRIDDLKLEPALTTGDLGRLGHYRIVRQLGQGGVAVVMEAIDTRLDRSVAIKMLRPDRATVRERERFVREAQALAKIKHTNVVDIYDVADPGDGLPYFVTELMHGSLRAVVQQRSLDERQAARLIAAVADGLQAAHDVGLMHRDIKPGNILLGIDQNNQPWHPKLSDFGLARFIEPSLMTTQTIGLSGTPAYMSPEQITTPNQITLSTDIYSLGVTLYEIICGELPFRGAAHAVMNQIVQDDVPWPHRFNPSVSRELETICLKALAREPQQRYPSAAAFAQDLRNWLAGKPIVARPPGAIGTFTRWCRRNPRVAMLTGTVLGLMLLLTVVSSLSTLRILSSQAALRERTVAAEQAQAQAESAEAAARLAAEQATQQRRITLDTLNELVGSVQTQLEKRPDTSQLRQSLLSKAFDGLQSVTRALEDEEQIDRAMIDAHIKMSSIKLEFSDRESAIEQTGKAIVLAKKALDRQPTNIECMRDFANALATQFEIHYSAFANDKALELAEKIIEIRTRICEQLPDDPSAARALIVIKQRRADLQWNSGQSSQALESYSSLLNQIDLLQQQVGEKLDLRRDKCVLLNRVGNLYLQTGDLSKAEQMYMAGRAGVDQLLKSDPANIIYRADEAFVLGRLVMLKSAQEDFPDAVEFAQATIDAYQKLIETEPDRIQFRTLLGSSYDLLYQVLLAQGDLPAAIVAEEHSVEIAKDNCARDPSTTRYPALAADAAQKIADLHVRQGNLAEAEVWYSRSVELIAMAHSTADYSAAAIAPAEMFFQRALRAVQTARKGSAACEELLESDAVDARTALVTLAYIEARSGKAAAARSTTTRLLALPPLKEDEQLNFLFTAARTLSLCHKQADASLKAQLEAEALSTTRAYITAQPQGKSALVLEPDFSSLRGLDAFKEILK